MKDFRIKPYQECRIPLYRQIHDHILEQIRSAELLPGERLISLIQLARKLGVSFNTVARAYRLLEIEQHIEKKRGRGSFVTGMK